MMGYGQAFKKVLSCKERRVECLPLFPISRQDALLLTGLCFLLSLSLLCPASLSAEEFVQHLPQGRVNWYSGEIVAESDSFAEDVPTQTRVQGGLAVRQARMEARKRLWKTLLRMHIDRGLTVSDRLSDDQSLSKIMRSRVHNSLLQTLPQSDVAMKVRAVLKVRGDLAEKLIPQSVWFANYSSLDSQKALNSSQAPGALLRSGASSAYTGLIVDLRAFDVTPALILRIYGSQGQEIYGPTVVDRKQAVLKGLCLYVTDVQSAATTDRVGRNPFLVRAEGIRQNTAKGIWFSDQVAAEFLASSQLESIYQQCRVVIVLKKGDRSS